VLFDFSRTWKTGAGGNLGLLDFLGLIILVLVALDHLPLLFLG
jgi:hypothetical protein